MTWVYIIAIGFVIIILLQSLKTVVMIRNTIVNTFLLLYLLLQELWKAIRYLHALLKRSATTRHRYEMVIQPYKAAFRRAWEAIWSIWSFEDRLRSRLLPAGNPETIPEPTREPTPETTRPPGSSEPARCAGYTDKGRCERKSHVDGEVYYCYHHERQDPRAYTHKN